jgi:hypothetical protein
MNVIIFIVRDTGKIAPDQAEQKIAKQDRNLMRI